ncbi:hypothetical protein [Erythrobacter sp.]|uniref:hypothetical protein n=1 Tax=Erythrobacter sp. TaxID=1042 RepID=UPI0025F1B731|nr:hypothetical protein [Erythrobacter sp.]
MDLSSVTIGLLSGLLFFVHAMFPFSHAWPLMWLLLGGIAAVYLGTRRRRVQSFAKGVLITAKAGAVAGALFLAATVAALLLLSEPSFDTVAISLGANGQIAVNTPVILSLSFAALIGVIVAVTAGALAYPLVRPRTGDQSGSG